MWEVVQYQALRQWRYGCSKLHVQCRVRQAGLCGRFDWKQRSAKGSTHALQQGILDYSYIIFCGGTSSLELDSISSDNVAGPHTSPSLALSTLQHLPGSCALYCDLRPC